METEQLGSNSVLLQKLFGSADENIKKIEDVLKVHISVRDGRIVTEGAEEASVDHAERVMNALLRLCKEGWNIEPSLVQYVITMEAEDRLDQLEEMSGEIVATTHRGRPIRCRTLGQRAYMGAVKKHTLTFAVGPAGTGKTFLAMAAAVNALKNREVERLVLTRPAVEAGEKLGFLPGDLTQKVDPYLRPLYDAMIDIMGAETCQRYQERGVIEVAPLAYMRGRTLSDAFIILDEAQNTTREQMKMFLTRIGFRSKVIITGDPSQVDLPRGKRSGLDEALEVLDGVKGISIMRLNSMDVVRHELVQAIVEAYERYDSNREEIHNAELARGAAEAVRPDEFGR